MVLSSYIDDKGISQKGKLYKALIQGIKPTVNTDEFGNLYGDKYEIFNISNLSDEQRGVSLLPEPQLRGERSSIDYHDWSLRADNLIKFSQGKKVPAPINFQNELNELIDLPVDTIKYCSHSKHSISTIFEIQRGDQGLTEAEIYRFHDTNGIPVYGGSSGAPRFKVTKNIKNNKNIPATIFKGAAIVVSMDGSAGSVQMINKSIEFCCNHHGRVLILKPAFNKLDLNWIVQQISNGLKHLASNKEGSATLTVPLLEKYEVSIPSDVKIISEIAKRRQKLVRLAAMYK